MKHMYLTLPYTGYTAPHQTEQCKWCAKQEHKNLAEKAYKIIQLHHPMQLLLKSFEHLYHTV